MLFSALVALVIGATPAAQTGDSGPAAPVQAFASPAPASPSLSAPSDAAPRRRAGLAAGGMLAGSAALWAATVGLRMLPELRARRARRACLGDDPGLGEALACPPGVGIAHALDTVTFWGLSYATVLPATGLLGGAGYFAGNARRRALARPRAIKGLGIAAIVGGIATWLIPRLAFAAVDSDRLFASLNPTFYSGLGVTGVGAAITAYAEGARAHRPTQPRVSVTASPAGVQLSGAF